MAANMSYTLYAVHFPLLAFLYFMLLAPRQFQPEFGGIAILAGFSAAAIITAIAAWFVFERNTQRVRIYASRVFNLVGALRPSRSGAASPEIP
jgi:peptidoglycan/LPS O-acetylase OafA/YrhL